MRNGRHLLVAAGLLLAGWQWGQAGWIAGKALTAQWLLERAWQSGGTSAVARPWPWADFSPVARLAVPALGVDRIVLSDASGRTLAFGPGHLPSSARPGAEGTIVLAGHRDTHFAFLRRLQPGMNVTLETPDGRALEYRVTATRIVDTRHERVSLGHPGRLVLSTCWPFDALDPGGPLCFLVVAERRFPADGDGPARGTGKPSRPGHRALSAEI